ncbi:MAG: hypothetical protein NXI10_15020 [bacterium]|nr:hypothetical protein [bacterium]
MKHIAILALLLLILTSCIKDKLEKDSLVLSGTWNWQYSIEYTYDSVNDTVLTSIIPASNYSDSYSIRIEEKGRIYQIKNSEEEKYRLVLPEFKSGLCFEINNSYKYKILPDNKEADSLVGCVNEDTLITSDWHLPLSKGTSEYPYYKHVFTK